MNDEVLSLTFEKLAPFFNLPLEELQASFRSFYQVNYPDSLINFSRTIAKTVDFNQFENLSKLILKQTDISNISLEINKIFSEYVYDYSKLDFKIPIALDNVVVEAFKHPDKVQKFLSKELVPKRQNHEVNSLEKLKESRTKETYGSQSNTNYYINPMQVNHQFPASKKSDNWFNDSPKDKIPKDIKANNSIYITQLLFFLICLFDKISELPDFAEGIKMISNVLSYLLNYFIN